ncbi:class I SAM-dependent methyltransferase [Microvirga tunisiensis]|uniref:Class I SAM-dependent methyltransferase n=1 Tax=Pannonibacter tanglangensis TaxID=2750084 RepID=A0A7X5EZC3_9HYPH|nr:class I SAM-dependent methyltransferase [Pannonibacter sp. XCT-53]NBN76908.1 class I SAM-dependent methyltransferase [Pannonibacter sp. XCT-53]
MSENRLKARLEDRIRLTGPMSVADYMTACLADPQDGYYTTSPEPFGRDGDFITAPEVSQMFGELIGGWVLATWIAMGTPDPVHLVELGPGRGTLMADLLRTARLRPAFLAAVRVHLVEVSPRLRARQADTLAPLIAPLSGTLTGSGMAAVTWHDRLAEVPAGPTILIANEFFDALPIRQYQKTPAGWRERVVGLDATGALTFGVGGAALAEDVVPTGARDAAPGAILEVSPASLAVAQELAGRLVSDGGAALLIDYGHLRSAPGDTLQALSRHAFADPLAEPGKADLTAHVDFEALARAATHAGAEALAPLTQGEFLLRLGLLERAGQLGAGKDAATQERLRGEVERLAAPDQMGELFKVLALAAPGLVPPGFERRGK